MRRRGEHDPIGDVAHLPRCSRSSSPAVTTAGVDDTVCCYAEKTETWVHAPDGNRWEWCVKHADAEQFENTVTTTTTTTTSSCCT